MSVSALTTGGLIGLVAGFSTGSLWGFSTDLRTGLSFSFSCFGAYLMKLFFTCLVGLLFAIDTPAYCLSFSNSFSSKNLLLSTN
jgi:hypothetical protein